MKNRSVINGDPCVLHSNYRIPIHWYDRLFNDQMDAYRDYADENEHSNEKLGWSEYKENFSNQFDAENLEFRWWEYEGKGRNGNDVAPLVVIMDEYYNTIWQRLADENDLVLIATEYHRPQLDAPGTQGYGARECEIDVYKLLLDRMCSKYNINKKRIYFFGLSYGDMTTYMFIRKYKELLAGAVFMNGCMRGNSLRQYPLPDGLVLPTLHLRADSDYNVDGYFDGLNFDAKGNKGWLKHMRAKNVGLLRKNWIKCIKANPLPKISSKGDSTFLIYQGKEVPMIYNELVCHSHIAPLSYAQIAWDYIFSIYRREDNGTIGVIRDNQLDVDQDAIGLAMGCSKAYINNRVVELNAPSFIVEPAKDTPSEHVLFAEENIDKESFYAPLDILEKGFGINYNVEDLDNNSVWTCNVASDRITLDDKIIHFEYNSKVYDIYTNSPLVKEDGKYISMGRPTLTIDGNLMIPIKELSKMLGKCCSINNGAAYISDTPMSLGYATAAILREEILDDKFDLEFDIKVDHMVGKEESNFGNDVILSYDDGKTIKSCAHKVPEGCALMVDVKKQNPGDKVNTIVPYVNGLEVPFFDMGDGKYRVENVFGNISIEIY